jgi:antitoxin HigA-1
MAYERRSAAAWAIHPGDILKKEFLQPMKITGYRLAKALDVNAQRVSDIMLRKTGVSAEMAVLLGKYFGMSPEFWMNLQAAWELAGAKKQLKKKLEKVKPLANAA